MFSYYFEFHKYEFLDKNGISFPFMLKGAPHK